MPVVMHWFRRDLRLTDNLALHAACASGGVVIPLFIFDEHIYRSPRVGAPRMAFMLNALAALDQSLRRYHTRLLVRHGNPAEVIPALVDELGITALYYNADYSPYARQRDSAVEQRLSIPTYDFDDVALTSPGSVLTASGTPYTVFTPFRRTWNTLTKPDISSLALRADMFHPLTDLPTEAAADLTQLGYTELSMTLPEATEEAAQKLLAEFMAEDIVSYEAHRNSLPIQPFIQPRPTGTAYLSPYLRLGLLSPRMAYHAARAAYQQTSAAAERQSIETWVSELTWRDFYMHILYHFPYVLTQDFQTKFRGLRWDNNPQHLANWQAGMTGYPIIDAPMRQMNSIGWMPNRARMIVASFLTKDLLIHWKYGDLWFMQHLIDGDPAANNGGWQWAAGTGTDAQPYFRIFNPVSQSKQYASPAYLRYWLPELQQVSDEYIHEPWMMKNPPPDYPPPIVDHAVAREKALAVFKEAAEQGAKSS